MLFENKSFEKQVDKSHYNELIYNTKGRFASYWHQIDEVMGLNPEKILEIGVGNRFFSNFIKSNFDVILQTVDIDNELGPDHVGSVTDLPLETNAFDCVCCFQVLEHLPFDDMEKALKVMRRVSRRWIVLSLPDQSRFVGIKIHKKLFPIKKIEVKFSIPFLFSYSHHFDGQHYWEIGARGYSLKRIKQTFGNSRLKLVRTFRVFEMPIHRFFVLEKQ